MRRSKRRIVCWSAAAVVFLLAIPLVIAWGVSGPQVIVGKAMAAAVEAQPTVVPSAVPAPVIAHDEVAAFLPTSIKIYQVLADGSEHDFVGSDGKGVPMDTQQLQVDSSGAVESPDAGPGVVAHKTRSLPGTNTGTTEVDGHARVYPPMVFTPLMDLPYGTLPFVGQDYRVDLAGPQGQLLTYVINEVVVLDKGDITTRPEFNENTPDRFLGYTCQVENGQPVVSDRVVVGTLFSSKAA